MWGVYRNHRNPLFQIPFLSFALMMFFVTTADACMSYMAPLIMEHAVGATKMGLILATSSFAGTFMDFTFARLFHGKKASFFLKILFSLVLFFPLSFLFFRSVPSFVFAMVVWGVYFEAIVFSGYHAIHELVEPANHAWAWGSLMTFKNLGWFLGPLLASLLEGLNSTWPFYLAIGFYIVGMIVFVLRRFVYPVATNNQSILNGGLVQHDLIEEFKIWGILFRTIWPMLLLSFTFILIDSTFFSIGPVFADNLRVTNPLGGLFISMYTLPGLLFGVFAGMLARPWGKKRIAFASGMLAGLGLIVMSRVTSVWLIVTTTFFASAGLSIFYPEITAVYEDYMARAKKFGNDLIGLTAAMSSVAYVVGPILNGFLADQIGAQAVFGLWGSLMLVLSLVALLVVKRKVRLPQKEIAAVEVSS